MAGYPGLMVTDTAALRYPYYHKADDLPDKLRYDFLNAVVEGLTDSIGMGSSEFETYRSRLLLTFSVS